MQKFRSHKIVEAGKIGTVKSHTVSSTSDTGLVLYVDGGNEDGYYFNLGHNIFARMPTGWVPSDLLGSYLVRYSDGYYSLSPAKAFEEGYRSIDGDFAEVFAEVNGYVSFGDAIAALKQGKRVARAGWNGKGMWLSLSGDAVREIPSSSFWSPNNAAYAKAQGGAAKVLPCITMKTATGEILMGWLASQTDMLAEDWLILPYELQQAA